MDRPESENGRTSADLISAAKGVLEQVLLPESPLLVQLHGHVEAAIVCSVDPSQADSVQSHCREALQIIDRIEQRHCRGDLPEPVAGCLLILRNELNEALQRAAFPPPVEDAVYDIETSRMDEMQARRTLDDQDD